MNQVRAGFCLRERVSKNRPFSARPAVRVSNGAVLNIQKSAEVAAVGSQSAPTKVIT